MDPSQFVRELNNAWIEGRYDDLRGYLHADVVMTPPGGSAPIVGAEQMIDSYREFGAIAEVHSFEVTEVAAFEFGQISVCHLSFAIEYEINGKRFNERGTEVYVIEDSGSGPKIVWRTQVPR